MKLDVPYYKQEALHTCGLAALRMVFDYFNVSRSEEDLCNESGTNPETGTAPQKLIEVVKKEGFHFFEQENSSLENVSKFLALKFPVIVSYVMPGVEEGHYSVITGFERDKIIFNDPWTGKDFELPAEEFQKRWYGQFDGEKQWMLVISDKPF